MTIKTLASAALLLAIASLTSTKATGQAHQAQTAPAPTVPGSSNEKRSQPKRIEDAYPLKDEAARRKTAKVTQQMTVDLLAILDEFKEAHWNVDGPLDLPLHEFYQESVDF